MPPLGVGGGGGGPSSLGVVKGEKGAVPLLSSAAWQGYGSLNANAAIFIPNAGRTNIGPPRREIGGARDEPLGPPGWSRTIKLKVREESGNIFTCELEKSARFAKIFNAYAQERGLQPSTLKFSFQGRKILSYDTPELLLMLGKAEIDVSQLIAAPSDTPSGGGGADVMPSSVDLRQTVPPPPPWI